LSGWTISTDGKNTRCKLSDGKFGHLSTTPNNNLVILYQHHIFFLCENVNCDISLSIVNCVFEPKKHYLREVLLYFFSVKKSVIELHRLLVEAYGEAALSETTCRNWFRLASKWWF